MGKSSDRSANGQVGRGAGVDWEQRLKRLTLTTGTIVWTAPAAGPFDEGMQDMAEFAGVPAAALSGEGWADFVHPAEREDALLLSRQAKLARGPVALSCRFRRRDGVYRHFTVSAAPLLDEDGEVREWVGVASDETERRATEAACRERTQLLQALIESAPAILFALDAQGRFTTCEGKLLREAPGGPLQLVGLSIFECIARTPDSQAAVRRALAGEAAVWEGEIDGLRLMAHLLPVCDDAGQPGGAVGVALDYTELRSVQEALRESEAHYRTLVETSPDLVFIIDRERRVKYVNERAAQPFAQPPAELVGHTLAELFDEKTAARMSANVEGTFQSGEAAEVEGGWSCPRGTAWFTTWLVPLKDEGGAVREVFGVSREITGRRQAEAALRASEEMRDIAEEVAGVGSWRWDVASGVIDWSPNMRVLYDGHVDDFGGDLDALLDARIHPDDREWVRTALGYLTRPGEPPTVEWRVVHRDGSVHVIRSSAKVVRDPDGAPQTIIGYGQDVTEQVEAEAEIRHLNEELQRRVVDRTTQLEAVTRELESFAYSAAHDLRAPLRAIDGFSAIVMADADERLTPEEREHLQRVRAAAQRMGQLIDDILGLSRLSRIELRRELVDLSAMAHAVCAELRAEQPQRRVEVSVEPGIIVSADPALLRVILRNLLENAWKFTARHEWAHVHVVTVEAHGETAIAVTDDGAGFDPRYADHLFGPFQRLHRADEFEGDGIGLATVQRLVYRHGGRVWAQGEVERGAAFYFTLPTGEQRPGGRVR